MTHPPIRKRQYAEANPYRLNVHRITAARVWEVRVGGRIVAVFTNFPDAIDFAQEAPQR